MCIKPQRLVDFGGNRSREHSGCSNRRGNNIDPNCWVDLNGNNWARKANGNSKRVKTAGRNHLRLPKSQVKWKQIVSYLKRFYLSTITNEAAFATKTDEVVGAEWGSYILSSVRTVPSTRQSLSCTANRHSKDRIKRCSSRQNHPPRWPHRAGIAVNYLFVYFFIATISAIKTLWKIHNKRQFWMRV